MKSEFQSLIATNGVAKSSKSIKDTVFMYLYYWPLFLISLLLLLALAYIYLRYTIPLYSANTIINVRGETTNSKNSAGQGDLINNAMNGGRSAINLDNELGRLRSARLMTQVVRNSDLNISYFRLGRFSEIDVYHEAPFRLIAKDIQDSSSNTKLTITKPSGQGFTLQYGAEENSTSKTVGWNQVFTVSGNSFILIPRSSNWGGAEKYKVVWNPTLMTVYELMPKVSADVIGKTTNIAVSTTIENAKRGEDLLNRMVEVFKQMNLDDQNRNAQDKIFFIEDRLSKISQELKVVEKSQAGYQGENLLVGENAATYGIPVGQAQLEVDKIATQKRTLSIVQSALNSGEGKTLPAGGVSEGTLGTMIGSYNQAVLKRQTLAPQLAPNSAILEDLDGQIRNLKTSIADNLANNIRALDLQASNFSRQGGQFRSSVSVLPDKQRILNEITREKSIKESLYMYLLQKREETALSKSTTTPYEQIDLATSYGPVSPNKKSIYTYASLIGLAIPVAIIFLLSMINDKIKSRDEVEHAAKAQIVGEINHIKRKEDQFLPSLKGGIAGEQFRIIRANLNFLQKGSTHQTILVTSSGSGEGKSFVSLNLAAVLSKTGKKVALLDFDLRKPDESMPSSLSGKGIKDYLLGEASLPDISQKIGELPNLDLYPSGQVIADVGDLIVSERADDFFAELNQQYDVIVVNTPPVGLVGDALILQKYSTLICFVIREGFTKKKQINYLNSLIDSGKFANACVIYNGVRTGMKYGYYGYGDMKHNSYFDRNGNNRLVNVFKRKKRTTVS